MLIISMKILSSKRQFNVWMFLILFSRILGIQNILKEGTSINILKEGASINTLKTEEHMKYKKRKIGNKKVNNIK